MTPSPNTQDSIIAVSSPPGRSPRGLIRLSGDAVQTILAQLIREPVDQLPTRRLTRIRLKSPDLPVMLSLFNAPHSYTGQDTVELQIPGHPALLDRILHQAINAGARLAEPGEFTFRAFLAGKLDLTQAEGIAATIQATSDTQLKAARHLLDGELGNFARSLVDDLGNALALVEAGIDFTDQEDVVPIAPDELDQRLSAIEARLVDLLANSRSWSEVEALPWVVLVGAPSAGKSTLFNALLGSERAVIDPLPGTTRDVLCEPITMTADDGTQREWMLVDIAGLDDSIDRLISALDKQAQSAARQAIERADLIVRVIDGSPSSSGTCPTVPQHTATMTVLSKSDLVAGYTPAPDTLRVSAATGHHIDELKHAISDRLGQSAVCVSAEMLSLQPRHEQALGSARRELADARTRLAQQLHTHALEDMELIAGHLRQALDDLAGLGGQLSPDDVIGRVFATFCVGK